MSWFSLLFTNLKRKPTRTALTLLSLLIAFLLFMLLRTIGAAFSGDGAASQNQRVIVDAKFSMTDNLPIAHLRKLAQLPGVHSLTQMSWFGGYYQDPKNAFAKSPVDHKQFFTVFPELQVSPETLQRFAQSRRAVVVEETIAAQFGWQVGDVIPIRGDIWPQSDGSWDWEFELAGTYTIPAGVRLQPWFLLRFDYFNEAVADWVKNQVGWAIARTSSEVETQAMIDSIDAVFEDSADPVRTLSEDQYAQQFAAQIGDVGSIATAILGAVFFTIILLTANVASLSFRERTSELAVMKTLGFSHFYVAALVLCEAIALCVLGALSGIALAYVLEPQVQANLAQVIGGFALSWQTTAQAIALAAVLGLVIGMQPAFAAYQLSIVQALRESQ